MKTNKAFTLTELLVCIGIIALLAAILLPILFQARRQAQKATCQSNLRQIGLALRQYVDENDGTWPDPYLWGEHGFTAKKLLGCPQAVTPSRSFNPAFIPGYAYSAGLIPTSSGVNVGRRDKDIVYPATTVAVCDEAMGQWVTAGPDPYIHTPSMRPEGDEKGWLRHNGGGNYLFCDGHVKWYLPDAVGDNGYPNTDAGVRPTFALAQTEPPQ